MQPTVTARVQGNRVTLVFSSAVTEATLDLASFELLHREVRQQSAGHPDSIRMRLPDSPDLVLDSLGKRRQA